METKELRRERILKRKQRILYFGGERVTPENYSTYTKEERRRHKKHLKAFLKGKMFYRFGYRLHETEEGFTFKLPNILIVQKLKEPYGNDRAADSVNQGDPESNLRGDGAPEQE